MSMLPAFKTAAPSGPPILPLKRNPSWGDGPNPMLDSVPIVEAEVNNSRVPELDAEAPGPHILEIGTAVLAEEMETVERALELESKRPIVELEGTTRRW